MTENLPANIAALADLATAVAANPGALQVGGTYLKFHHDEGDLGLWTYGADQEEADPEGEWVVNPFSLQHGWIRWTKNLSTPDKVMAPATKPMPVLQDLPVSTAPEKDIREMENRAVTLACISGDDEGIQATFETSSGGGKDAWAELLGIIFRRAQEGLPTVYPIVKLGYGKPYTASTGKFIRKPRFILLGWTDENGMPEPEELEDKSDTGVAFEDEPAAEPEPEKKRRRRRRA